jgi:hypothetical protein
MEGSFSKGRNVWLLEWATQYAAAARWLSASLFVFSCARYATQEKKLNAT